MPLYDYDCTNCNHSWEEVNSMANATEPLSQPCPKCGVLGYVRKLISPTKTVEIITIKAGAKIDKGLRNTLDQMKSKYKGMKWTLGT